jgi:2-hydroxychromene-2-carboxylate isomerase
MAHIEYFFATTSPFTYLAGTRMEEVAEAWRDDHLPPARHHGAVRPHRRHGPEGRHPARLDYRLQELERLSKKHDLPMNLDPPFRAVNPAPSSYAFIAAAKAGRRRSGQAGPCLHRRRLARHARHRRG